MPCRWHFVARHSNHYSSCANAQQLLRRIRRCPLGPSCKMRVGAGQSCYSRSEMFNASQTLARGPTRWRICLYLVCYPSIAPLRNPLETADGTLTLHVTHSLRQPTKLWRRRTTHLRHGHGHGHGKWLPRRSVDPSDRENTKS